MKRFGTFLLIIIGFALIASLYVIKTRTQSAGYEVKRLKNTLSQEQIAITVLNAEIAHLESPSRLGELSAKYLELRPTTPDQIMTLDEVIVRVPLRAQAPVDTAEGAP